jgi:hypothetical protein
MFPDALCGPDGTQEPEPVSDPLARRTLGGPSRLPAPPAPGARPVERGSSELDPPTGPVEAEKIVRAERADPRAARGSAVPEEVRGASRPTTHEMPRRRRANAVWLVLFLLLLVVLAYNLVRLLYTTFH